MAFDWKDFGPLTNRVGDEGDLGMQVWGYRTSDNLFTVSSVPGTDLAAGWGSNYFQNAITYYPSKVRKGDVIVCSHGSLTRPVIYLAVTDNWTSHYACAVLGEDFR